jgi:hypothetical protein
MSPDVPMSPLGLILGNWWWSAPGNQPDGRRACYTGDGRAGTSRSRQWHAIAVDEATGRESTWAATREAVPVVPLWHHRCWYAPAAMAASGASGASTPSPTHTNVVDDDRVHGWGIRIKIRQASRKRPDRCSPIKSRPQCPKLPPEWPLEWDVGSSGIFFPRTHRRK